MEISTGIICFMILCLPFLLAVLCGFLTLNNGQVSYNSQEVNGKYPVGTVATYTCNYGYRLAGSRSRICQKSGLWNKNHSTCRQSKHKYFFSKAHDPTNTYQEYVNFSLHLNMTLIKLP